MGRPSIRTQAKADEIAAIIARTGAAFGVAAEKCGISHQAAFEWRKEDPDFAAIIARASAEWNINMIDKILQDETGRRTSGLTWLLSRHIRSYGDKIQVEHSGEIAQRVINPERLSELQARVGKASAS